MPRKHFAVALLSIYPAIVPQPAMAQEDTPRCGVFFEKWDVPGAPQGILVMAGIGRELMAAQDCVTRKQTTTACEHYRRILNVIDTRGTNAPAISRADVEELMRHNNCAS